MKRSFIGVRWPCFVVVAFVASCGAPTEQCGPPPAPTGVVAVAGDGVASVSWTAPDQDGGCAIGSYRIDATPPPTGLFLFATTVPASSTEVKFANLRNGTSYTFTVTAINTTLFAGGGSSPPSAPSNLVTPAGKPDSPTDVAARAAVRSAVVGWHAPAFDGGSEITSYSIYAAPGDLQWKVDAPATATTFPGLLSGQAYTFTVKATTSAGTSAPSQPSDAVTLPVAPDPPTGVEAVSGSGQATVTWVAPAHDGRDPIVSYTVMVYPGDATLTVAAPTTSATMDGLSHGGTYTFAVVATNGVGDSSLSAPAAPVTVE